MINDIDVAACQLPGAIAGLATNFRDRRDAFRLIHDAYVKAGLALESHGGLRVVHHQLLEGTRIFVMKIQQQVVSTLTLVSDGPEGLPLDTVFSTEMSELRATGLRIAEIGAFADRREQPSRFIDSFCQLATLTARYAMTQSIDGFIIAVHPRHARFYKKFLCFESIGHRDTYALVNDLPAEALYLDFERARREHPDKYQAFFAPKATDDFTNGALSDSDVRFFNGYVAADNQEATNQHDHFAPEAREQLAVECLDSAS